MDGTSARSGMSGRSLRQRLLEPSTVGKLSPVGAAAAYAILIVWSAIVIFPAYWFAISTFKSGDTDFSAPHYVPFLDFQPTLDTWRFMLEYYPNCNVPDIFRQFGLMANNAAAYLLSPIVEIEVMEPRLCRIWQSVTNSLVTGISATALSVLAGSMAAYALVRIEYRPRIASIIAFVALSFGLVVASSYSGAPWFLLAAVALALFFLLTHSLGRYFKARLGNGAIMFWIITQRILPPVVVALPLYALFQKIGLLDTTTALIIIYAVTNLPIVVWFMHGFFAAVPIELEESALIEGASRFTIFREIALPLTRPGLAATTLLCLLLNWNEYIFAVALTTRHAPTLPVFAELWGETTVFLLMVIPPIIMAVFLQRYIRSGVFLGGVKG